MSCCVDLRPLLFSWPFRIFYCYLVLICVFSVVYYVAYYLDDDGFVFNKDIRDPRFLSSYREAKQRFQELQNQRAAIVEVKVALATRPTAMPRLGETSTVETPTYNAVFSSTATIISKNDAAQPTYSLDLDIYDKQGRRIYNTGDSSMSSTKELRIDLASDLARLDQWIASAQRELNDFDTARATDAEANDQGARHPQPRIWRLADFFYFSVITQTTVGYGDILPNQTYIRMIVAFQIICGLVLLSIGVNTTFPVREPQARQGVGGETVGA